MSNDHGSRRSAFLMGAARIFDFANALQAPRVTTDPAEADRRAIQRDWEAIGQDLYRAIETHRKEVTGVTGEASSPLDANG